MTDASAPLPQEIDHSRARYANDSASVPVENKQLKENRDSVAIAREGARSDVR